MAEPIPSEEQSNYETFRECMSEPVLRALATPIEKSKSRKKRHARKGSKSGKASLEPKVDRYANALEESQASDAEDLGDFIDVRHAICPIQTPTNKPVPKQLDLPQPSPGTAHTVPLQIPGLSPPTRNIQHAPLRLDLHRTPAHAATPSDRQPGVLCAAAARFRHHRPA